MDITHKRVYCLIGLYIQKHFRLLILLFRKEKTKGEKRKKEKKGFYQKKAINHGWTGHLPPSQGFKTSNYRTGYRSDNHGIIVYGVRSTSKKEKD